MANFFERIEPQTAIRLEQLSRLSFQARESRNAVLAIYGVESEDALLDRIREGLTGEHPAYEHYLAARILADTREVARAMIANGSTEPPSLPLHMELATAIAEDFPDGLAVAPEQTLDALVLRLANGIVLTVHYAAPDAYSLRWQHGDREAGIDTATVHPDLATAPNHFHDATGQVLADPLTDPRRAPTENLRALVHALLDGTLSEG